MTLTLALTLAVVCCAPFSPAAPAEKGASSRTPLKVLNGQPRLIVVNGYSTSFQWPKVLQAKLDRFFEGKARSPVQVVSATAGGTPIAKWMDVETGQPLKPWGKLRKALGSRGDRPAIVLCQQSLQWAYGSDRRAGIDGPQDRADIRKGAGIIGKYVGLLHDSGADLVFVAMHIYKHPMEPQIGNERLALAAYAKTKPKNFAPGPDVWTPTKPIYPWGFARDRLHPGKGAIAVMAHLWFQTLCRHDGLEVPRWSKQEMEKALEAAKTGAGDGPAKGERGRQRRPRRLRAPKTRDPQRHRARVTPARSPRPATSRRYSRRIHIVSASGEAYGHESGTLRRHIGSGPRTSLPLAMNRWAVQPE